jgi:hypothetical protein
MLALPYVLQAQSDDGDVSLGDFARAQRMNKQAAKQPEINNDNFSQLMLAAEENKPWDTFKYSISGTGNSFQVSAPDVTCNLSFNSSATALLTDPFAVRSLPDTEIAKLNGPARIDGDTFEISVYNGSNWTLREMIIALTIVHPNSSMANYGAAKLVPASSVAPADTDQKLSDTTLLFHMKGSASAAATTIFKQTLESQLGPGDDWHWAIIDAKGTPPRPDVVLPPSLDPSLMPAQTQAMPQQLPQPQSLPNVATPQTSSRVPATLPVSSPSAPPSALQ